MTALVVATGAARREIARGQHEEPCHWIEIAIVFGRERSVVGCNNLGAKWGIGTQPIGMRFVQRTR